MASKWFCLTFLSAGTFLNQLEFFPVCFDKFMDFMRPQILECSAAINRNNQQFEVSAGYVELNAARQVHDNHHEMQMNFENSVRRIQNLDLNESRFFINVLPTRPYSFRQNRTDGRSHSLPNQFSITRIFPYFLLAGQWSELITTPLVDRPARSVRANFFCAIMFVSQHPSRCRTECEREMFAASRRPNRTRVASR